MKLLKFVRVTSPLAVILLVIATLGRLFPLVLGRTNKGTHRGLNVRLPREQDGLISVTNEGPAAIHFMVEYMTDMDQIETMDSGKLGAKETKHFVIPASAETVVVMIEEWDLVPTLPLAGPADFKPQPDRKEILQAAFIDESPVVKCYKVSGPPSQTNVTDVPCK